MDKETFSDKVRGFIGGIGWRVFLWSIRMTQEQYLAAVYADEQEHRANNGRD